MMSDGSIAGKEDSGGRGGGRYESGGMRRGGSVNAVEMLVKGGGDDGTGGLHEREREERAKEEVAITTEVRAKGNGIREVWSAVIHLFQLIAPSHSAIADLKPAAVGVMRRREGG